MQKPMLESIKTILKEWDSSKILDAAFKASEAYGEDPDWSDVIDTILDKMSEQKFNEYLKNMEMTKDEFYDGLSEADPDSVISGLEPYLSQEDIKDICSMYEPEKTEEDEVNKVKPKKDNINLSKEEAINIITNKVNELVESNDFYKLKNKDGGFTYYFIGKAGWEKLKDWYSMRGINADSDTLFKYFEEIFVSPLKSQGIKVSRSRTANYHYGCDDYEYDFYVGEYTGDNIISRAYNDNLIRDKVLKRQAEKNGAEIMFSVPVFYFL